MQKLHSVSELSGGTVVVKREFGDSEILFFEIKSMWPISDWGCQPHFTFLLYKLGNDHRILGFYSFNKIRRLNQFENCQQSTFFWVFWKVFFQIREIALRHVIVRLLQLLDWAISVIRLNLKRSLNRSTVLGHRLCQRTLY